MTAASHDGPDQRGAPAAPLVTTPDNPADLHQRISLILAVTGRTGHTAEQLIAAWLGSRANTQDARATYGLGLRKLLQYCAEHNLDLLTLAGPDADMYGVWLQQQPTRPGSTKPYGYNTRRRYIIAASSFYTYLVERDVRDRSPFTRHNRLRDRRDLAFRATTPEQTEKLMADAAAEHRTLGPLCARLAGELLYLGLRATEVCSINLHDVLLVPDDDGTEIRVIRYRAKGGDLRFRSIPPDIDRDVLTPYLQARPTAAGPEHAYSLLLTLKGERLNRYQLNYLIKRGSERNNLGQNVTPHSGRHTYVRDGRNAGIPETELSRAVGHANLATTALYGQVEHTAANDPSRAIAAYRAQHRPPQPHHDQPSHGDTGP